MKDMQPKPIVSKNHLKAFMRLVTEESAPIQQAVDDQVA